MSGSRRVYSTGPDGPVEPASGGSEPGETSLPPAEQSPRVRRERSGRKGKTVTVAEPLRLCRADAETLVRQLKKSCGGGGALRRADDGWALEIQGDHAERIVEELLRRGYRAKRSGG